MLPVARRLPLSVGKMIHVKSKTIMLAIALSAGCGSQGAYVPEERATATLGGRTAAAYPLPTSQNQQVQVRVASYGVAELEGEGDRKALHLRMAVADAGKDPLVMNTSEQRVQLPDGRQLAPTWARATTSAPPLITVQPGTAQTIDLYFEIPEEADPSRFDAIWRVQLGNREMSRITPFDKVAVDPAVARAEAAEDLMYGPDYYGYGWYGWGW
jgi:hypothetical protein